MIAEVDTGIMCLWLSALSQYAGMQTYLLCVHGNFGVFVYIISMPNLGIRISSNPVQSLCTEM